MLWISTSYATNDPKFLWMAPAQSILQKIIRFFCLRVDPNPQSQQRGRSFLCVTMFPGWHAKEYLCRFSENQISRTNCAQTVISKFPKALRLIFCLRLDASCFVFFRIERVKLLKANMLVSRRWECTSIWNMSLKSNKADPAPVKHNYGLPLLQNKKNHEKRIW